MTETQKTFDRSWALVFKNSKVWGSPDRVCDRGARRYIVPRLGFRKPGRTFKFTCTQLVVVRCAYAQKPAGFSLEIFFLVFTQFLTKAGRICDEELLCCLYRKKAVGLSSISRPGLYQFSYPLIRFLSEALVTRQGLTKASFQAV